MAASIASNGQRAWQNPKSEARNPNQIRNSNDETRAWRAAGDITKWKFALVIGSYFGFRISNFAGDGGKGLVVNNALGVGNTARAAKRPARGFPDGPLVWVGLRFSNPVGLPSAAPLCYVTQDHLPSKEVTRTFRVPRPLRWDRPLPQQACEAKLCGRLPPRIVTRGTTPTGPVISEPALGRRGSTAVDGVFPLSAGRLTAARIL